MTNPNPNEVSRFNHLAAVLIICAGIIAAFVAATPVQNLTLQTNANAGGNSITNAASIQATNGYFANVYATNGMTGPVATANLSGIVSTSNGGTGASTAAGARAGLHLSPTFNVSDYGAYGDGKVIYDATFYAGSNTLTSTQATFTSAVTGATAAIQTTPTQRELVTLTYVNSTTVTMSTNMPCSSTNSVTVTNATNASPIVITTTAAHNAIAGQTVTISGVGGNTNANGTFTVASVPTATSMTLYAQNTTTAINGNAAYTSGGTLTISPNPLIYGHDDTAAIQSAITAAYNANGGVVQFNNAIYMCAGSPAAGSFGNSCNSVLEVPAAWQPQANLTITLRGVNQPRFVQWGLNEQFNTPYGQLLGAGGSVLYFPASATGGSAGNYPAAIAECAWNTSQGALANFSVTQLEVNNLQIMMAQNSGLSALQEGYVGGVKHSGLAITTDVYPGTMPNPAGNPSMGIIAPFLDNDNLCRFDDLYISGFNEALAICEHTFIDNYHAYYNVKALTFTAGSDHVNFINNFNPEECAYCIYSKSSIGNNTGPSYIFGTMDNEMTSSGATTSSAVSWAYGINDIYDATNILYGYVTYCHSGLGTSPPGYSVNGASNLIQINGLTGGGNWSADAVLNWNSSMTNQAAFNFLFPNLTAGKYATVEYGPSTTENFYFGFTKGSSANADLFNVGWIGGSAQSPI
ncbi:MAG TPA: hypothetical protein VL981_11110, partial [Candidatus Methylacidiphilales bacterium]|nr:hypothetical protein [Candidatus Methylacidiphilales bacterium]